MDNRLALVALLLLTRDSKSRQTSKRRGPTEKMFVILLLILSGMQNGVSQVQYSRTAKKTSTVKPGPSMPKKATSRRKKTGEKSSKKGNTPEPEENDSNVA